MDHPLRALFIGGTGRSGSNVLRARLAEHSQIASLPFETRFTVDPDGVLATYRALSAGASPFEMPVILTRLQRLLARLARRSPLDRAALRADKALRALGAQSNLRRYAGWELDKHIPGFSDHAARLLTDLSVANYPSVWPGKAGSLPYAHSHLAPCDQPTLDRAFSDFLTACFSALTGQIQASAVVDDNTYNLFFAPELTTLLPEAHLVHMLRDPRDVTASLMQQRWAPSDAIAACQFYDVSMSTILRKLGDVPAKRQHTIRLEALCADPMTTLEPLYAAVGLVPERRFDTTDFAAANAGRWRRDLTAADQQTLSQRLSGWVERFGYDA